MRKYYIFLFLILTLSGCSSLYHEHFFRENLVSKESHTGTVSFHASGTLVSLPNKKVQGDLVADLQGAKQRIWIEIYTWTDAAKLLDPIIQAHNRGVDVRVVLEGNVFGTPKINAPLFRKLKDTGIAVVYADNHRYTFTHAKFWIIDDVYYISTGNWTASLFTKNREYIYKGSDRETRQFLEEIFLADLSHLGFGDITKVPPQMVVSPLNTRLQIQGLISKTKKSILFYIQTLDDPEILMMLQELSVSGKDIEICTADSDTNSSHRDQFPQFHWRVIKKPYLHAKIIIIDDETLYVGSHNLTTNAIENNREMGIIFSGRPDIIGQVNRDFVHDGCR